MYFYRDPADRCTSILAYNETIILGMLSNDPMHAREPAESASPSAIALKILKTLSLSGIALASVSINSPFVRHLCFSASII